MVAQLHLALVMAIDAKLLVLDEPTLGLDILYRKQFYDSLLNDYFDGSRTILVTTHQVEEIEHVLTDRHVHPSRPNRIQSQHGRTRVALYGGNVHPDKVAAARALKPIHERHALGRSILLFEGVDRQQLATLGEVRTAGIADLFVAIIGNEPRQSERQDKRRGAMNTQTGVISPLEKHVTMPVAISASRSFYWSVRREAWENRSIYIAPLAVAALYLVGFLMSAIGNRPRCVLRWRLIPVQHEELISAALHLRRHSCSWALLSSSRSSTASMRCMANVVIAAFCSGSRCPFPISLRCSRRLTIPVLILPLITFAITLVTQCDHAAA